MSLLTPQTIFGYWNLPAGKTKSFASLWGRIKENQVFVFSAQEMLYFI